MKRHIKTIASGDDKATIFSHRHRLKTEFGYFLHGVRDGEAYEGIFIYGFDTAPEAETEARRNLK